MSLSDEEDPLNRPPELEIAVSSGAVDPHIFRGEPAKKKHFQAQPKRSPWERNFELCHQFPNQWVLFSEVAKTGVNCKDRLRLINADKRRVENFIATRWPLERWQMSVYTVEGTMCRKQLAGRYLYTLTPEEDELDRKERRERWLAMMRRREEKARERELDKRLRAKKGKQG